MHTSENGQRKLAAWEGFRRCAYRYEEVPVQLVRWIHCNGAVMPGLVHRRKQEIAYWQE
jgi:GH24 family phage-related lysozyme (muramidase)